MYAASTGAEVGSKFAAAAAAKETKAAGGGSNGGGGGAKATGKESQVSEAASTIRISAQQQRMVALPHHLPPMGDLSKLSPTGKGSKGGAVPWDPFGKPKLF